MKIQFNKKKFIDWPNNYSYFLIPHLINSKY